MDDNSGEWVECMGVASGSGWNLCVWLLGVVVRRYIDFLILHIPTPLVSVLFCSSIPTFCSLKKCFLFLFKYVFVIKFYALNNFFMQYKHTYGQLQAFHGSHMKAAHNILYMKKHKRTRTAHLTGLSARLKVLHHVDKLFRSSCRSC